VADAFAALGLIPKRVTVADIVWQPPGAAAARLAQRGAAARTAAP
jgi:hypothetical protein